MTSQKEQGTLGEEEQLEDAGRRELLAALLKYSSGAACGTTVVLTASEAVAQDFNNLSTCLQSGNSAAVCNFVENNRGRIQQACNDLPPPPFFPRLNNWCDWNGF